jgi:hypothetical protein
LKIKTLLLLVIILNSSSVISQNLWPHENAEWWFDLGPWLYSPSIEHRYVDGDTLIDDVSCTRLVTDWYWTFNPNSTDLNLHSSSEEYLYFNGDTLFWRKSEAFYPLICFNAVEGDSWFPLPQDDSAECEYNPVVVESAERVFYNEEPFRQITIAPYIEETATFYWGGSFDDRTFWRQFSYPAYNSCGSIVEWLTYNFRCYSDGELSIIESEGSCDAPLSISSITNSDIVVYPNPISRGELLKIEKAQVISLTSLSGQRLNYTKAMNKIEISRHITSGVYFLELMLPTGKRTHSKLLVR